jgi:CRP/FNR family transcriptional activator FtrB
MDAFHGLSLFQGVQCGALQRLAALSFLQDFPADVVLAEQGHVPDFLYGIVSGTLDATACYRSGSDTIGVFKAGHCISIAAVVVDSPLLSTIRTVDHARILMVPAGHVRELLANDVAFSNQALHRLATSTRTIVRELHNQKLRTSTERLANWVLRMADAASDEQDLPLPFQKRLLASLLGMTPENLSRTIAGLEPHGVVFRGRMIHVRDLNALKRMACPTPLIDA